MLDMYRIMLLISRTEEQLRDELHSENLPGGVHLYSGREAVAAGVCAHLNDTDRIASTQGVTVIFLPKAATHSHCWPKFMPAATVHV